MGNSAVADESTAPRHRPSTVNNYTYNISTPHPPADDGAAGAAVAALERRLLAYMEDMAGASRAAHDNILDILARIANAQALASTQLGERIMASFADLENKFRNMATVGDSVVAMVSGVAEQLRALAAENESMKDNGTDAQINALAAEMDAKAVAWAEAVKSGTSAEDEPAPAPAEDGDEGGGGEPAPAEGEAPATSPVPEIDPATGQRV